MSMGSQLQELLDLGKLKRMYRPHVVIAGAGASLQAFPNGDANGKKLPLMNNLVQILGLNELVERAGFADQNEDFEAAYAFIQSNPKLDSIRLEIEGRVTDYFASLRLPDEPTLYDYLILSLRDKDFIATFNWDPFLFYSSLRCKHVAPGPQILFLHGCAAAGYCLEHRKIGPLGNICPVCRDKLLPAPLLYPIQKKNYERNGFISSHWEIFRRALANAYLVTVFGYGAPITDSAAIDSMSSAWGDPKTRNLEQFEIIDIMSEDKLRERWKRFIHSHHYTTTKDYFESRLGFFPRRSCEAVWEEYMENHWLEREPNPRHSSLSELFDWFLIISRSERP